jgi:ADP-heptose:LPS heptosyltransferase
LPDFAHTAALVSNLDLVITVDTSIPHVSGALAREAWVLLPNKPGCHWMEHRPDSSWYPTLRLFRQPRGTTDWSGVVHQIAEKLRALTMP